ncbi:MAG: hypothetical protein ACJAZ5_000009 [Alloalcanivorax venustensis]|jgi:hypothetical protein
MPGKNTVIYIAMKLESSGGVPYLTWMKGAENGSFGNVSGTGVITIKISHSGQP